MVKYLMIAFVGGILCLDRTAVQLLISRPIVAAPILGAILGDPVTGLIIGSFLELLWINRVSVGGYIPPDDTLAAVVITGVTIIVSGRLGFVSAELISLSFIIFLPVALLGQRAQSLIIKSNDRLAELAEQAAEKPDIRMLELLHLRGLAKAFLVPAFLIMILTLSGVEILHAAYRSLPSWSYDGLRLSYYLLPLIGVAAGLNMIKLKRAVPVFAALSLAVIIFFEYLFDFR
ncbi:MAG: PTS sugar transporter subunit IIC [Smithellaceae bacterium]|nr:PTS sugar transporter subunit IIC [Smithellaceae bacterium]